MAASEEESMMMADLVRPSLLWVITLSHFFKLQKGVSSARSDDTNSLKGVVLNWIAALDMPLLLPLSRNVKTNRGFHHPITGALLGNKHSHLSDSLL